MGAWHHQSSHIVLSKKKDGGMLHLSPIMDMIA
jgi:hypothetical protein